MKSIPVDMRENMGIGCQVSVAVGLKIQKQSTKEASDKGQGPCN